MKKDKEAVKELDPKSTDIKPTRERKKKFRRIRTIINQNAKNNKPS